MIPLPHSLLRSTVEVLFLMAIQYCLQFHQDAITGVEVVSLQFHFGEQGENTGGLDDFINLHFITCDDPRDEDWIVLSHLMKLKALIKINCCRGNEVCSKKSACSGFLQGCGILLMIGHPEHLSS